MEIYKTPIGILVMEGDKVADKILFKKDAKAIAEKLSGECPEEAKLKAKYPQAREGTKRLPLGDIAEKLGFCKKSELAAIVSKVNEEMAKLGVSKGFGRDKLVVNAVRAQRALEANVNTQSETLREWYSIHFPELNNLLKENKDYAAVVSSVGLRKNMSEAALGKALEDKRYVKAIPPIAKQSIGSEIDKQDLKAIQDYADSILGSAKEETGLRKYIEETMEAIAPNLSEVATPYVGALLLEQAGSLEKLAKLPSSTIQVLGAQKAMFRFLKTKKLPPKYGVLYIHPLVSQAPKKSKGKLARTLASKISIAARVDFYGGKPVGAKLKKESEERAKSLKS
jgi:nucleolar protein 56